MEIIDIKDLRVARTVDELGAIQARKAELAKREKALKDQLVKLGPGAYAGQTFRATVVAVTRTLVDWRAIAERLKPSRQLVTAHTRETETVSVRVASRNAEVAE